MRNYGYGQRSKFYQNTKTKAPISLHGTHMIPNLPVHQNQYLTPNSYKLPIQIVTVFSRLSPLVSARGLQSRLELLEKILEYKSL